MIKDIAVITTVWRMRDAGFLPIQIRVYLEYKYKLSRLAAIEFINKEYYSERVSKGV